MSISHSFLSSSTSPSFIILQHAVTVTPAWRSDLLLHMFLCFRSAVSDGVCCWSSSLNAPAAPRHGSISESADFTADFNILN